MEQQEQQVIEEEIQVNFHRVEELENYGVNKVDVSKLKSGGYNTIESVNMLLSPPHASKSLIICHIF
jgi:hypothetical protein